MVIHEAEKMLATVPGPVFRAELLGQCMDDFKHVEAVKTGVESFVACVVGAAVQHAVVDEEIVISVQKFAQEKELRFDAVGEISQPVDEIPVETVSHIQTEAVNVEGIYPETDVIEDVLDHGLVPEIQLNKIVVAFPAFIPETVVVIGIAVEGDMEPILIGGIPFFLLHIPECPEAAADMIEYTVQDDFDSGFVECIHNLFKIFICAEAAVDSSEVSCIVAVGIRFEDRREVDGCDAELLQMRNPVLYLADAVHGHSIIIEGGAAEAERIDLIKVCAFVPHSVYHLSFFIFIVY